MSTESLTSVLKWRVGVLVSSPQQHYQSAHCAHVKVALLVWICSISLVPTWQVNPVFIYPLPLFFTRSRLYFFISALSQRKSGARQQPAERFQAFALLSFFMLFCVFNFLCFVSLGEKKKRMREGLAHESKRVDIRGRLGDIGVGAQRRRVCRRLPRLPEST